MKVVISFFFFKRKNKTKMACSWYKKYITPWPIPYTVYQGWIRVGGAMICNVPTSSSDVIPCDKNICFYMVSVTIQYYTNLKIILYNAI